jgi:hypothetical protein
MAVKRASALTAAVIAGTGLGAGIVLSMPRPASVPARAIVDGSTIGIDGTTYSAQRWCTSPALPSGDQMSRGGRVWTCTDGVWHAG